MKKIAIIVALGLTGCSHYSNHFDCPYGDGVGCASLSKVNQLLDHNLIDTSNELLKDTHNKQHIHVYYGPTKMDKVITIKGGYKNDEF
jgi:hypothetical protein